LKTYKIIRIVSLHAFIPMILKFSLIDDEVQVKVQLNSSGC
jgi:hypothetical protein